MGLKSIPMPSKGDFTMKSHQRVLTDPYRVAKVTPYQSSWRGKWLEIAYFRVKRLNTCAAPSSLSSTTSSDPEPATWRWLHIGLLPRPTQPTNRM